MVFHISLGSRNKYTYILINITCNIKIDIRNIHPFCICIENVTSTPHARIWKNTFSKIRIPNNDLRDTRTYILYICIISALNLNKDLPSPSVWKQAYNIEIVKECWYSRFHHHLISFKLNKTYIVTYPIND